MKTLAKWPWYRYISEMTNSKTDIKKHESISDWLFQHYKRLRLWGFVCLAFVCLYVYVCSLCIHWMTGLLLAECVLNICCVSTPCKAMQTVWSIPLRLSLMSLIGWSRHTPGSLGLSQEPGGQHNVYTVDGAQVCPCLYLKKNPPINKRLKVLKEWWLFWEIRFRAKSQMRRSIPVCLSTKSEAATSSWLA